MPSFILKHVLTLDFYVVLCILRHEVLSTRENFNSPDFSLQWGRHPPQRRYNMDQTPLPFVVSHDSTCTTEDDENVHVSAPKEALRKRQFIMHVFCNSGKGEDRDGYTALVCKGSPKGRRTQIEKLAYNNAPMLFQKNAWVGAHEMKTLANDFINHIKERHNGLGVLLFCDNLAAHVSDEVKEIFHKGNVFL